MPNGTRAPTGRRTLHGCPLSLSRSPPAHTHGPRFIAFGHLLPPPCVSLCALSGGAVCSSQAPLHRHQLLTASLSPAECPHSSSVAQAPVFTSGIVLTARCGDIPCCVPFRTPYLPCFTGKPLEDSSLSVCVRVSYLLSTLL